MTFLGLKMIIFGHFSPFLASFKISFSSLQHPKDDPFKNVFTWPTFVDGLANGANIVCLTDIHMLGDERLRLFSRVGLDWLFHFSLKETKIGLIHDTDEDRISVISIPTNPQNRLFERSVIYYRTTTV